MPANGRSKADFEIVVLQHLDSAYTLARWLMRNSPQDAEDALQDACMRALQAYAGFSGTSPRGWLLAIVRNVCLTRLRNRPRAVPLDDAMTQVDRVAALADEERRPDRQLVARNEQARVAAAIARLPDALREIIVLREIEELSYQDIADTVGVPIGTVMSRLSRGRERLKTMLSGDEG